MTLVNEPDDLAFDYIQETTRRINKKSLLPVSMYLLTAGRLMTKSSTEALQLAID